LRENLEYQQKRLDVMQRELNLMQTQFYSNPNDALREQTFRSQINQRTQEIDQQKAAVAKAQQAISDLEEELRKNGLPSGWAR
jgi:DNA mismatch repair ATPase MutS